MVPGVGRRGAHCDRLAVAIRGRAAVAGRTGGDAPAHAVYPSCSRGLLCTLWGGDRAAPLPGAWPLGAGTHRSAGAPPSAGRRPKRPAPIRQERTLPKSHVNLRCIAGAATCGRSNDGGSTARPALSLTRQLHWKMPRLAPLTQAALPLRPTCRNLPSLLPRTL